MNTTRNAAAKTLLTGLFLFVSGLAACAPTGGGTGGFGTAQPLSQPSTVGPPPSAGGGAVDSAAMLTAHHQWRAKVGVPDLSWSGELAAEAQKWADSLASNGCPFRHSDSRHGENLYKGSPGAKITPQMVVDAWGTESRQYNYADNSCSGICGHYTQLVWRTTKEVGCGMAVCGDKSEMWVCNYYPTGNFNGRRPY